MMRRIHCAKCHEARPFILHAEDVARGFEMRTKRIVAKKPPTLKVTIHSGEALDQMKTVREFELSSILCDACGEPIADGATAYAITLWRASREGEPGAWEAEYEMEAK